MKLLLLLVTCVSLATAGYAAEAFTHAPTGVTLPDTLAGMTRGEVVAYKGEPGQNGVAIPYHAGRVEVTVFIRTIDTKGPTSPAAIVEDSLETVKRLEKSGTYSKVEVYKTQDDPEAPGWAKAAYTAEMEGRPVVSLIYAAVKGGHAIKARITTSDLKDPSVVKFVAEFRKIVEAAKPSN